MNQTATPFAVEPVATLPQELADALRLLCSIHTEDIPGGCKVYSGAIAPGHLAIAETKAWRLVRQAVGLPSGLPSQTVPEPPDFRVPPVPSAKSTRRGAYQRNFTKHG